MLVKVFLLLLVVDSIYLYLTAGIFGETVKNIQHTGLSVRYGSAFIVYALLAYGLVHFIIKPGRSYIDAALLGLVIYGVFDFTNYAIFKDYGLPVAIMDTLWGAILMGTVAYIWIKL
jgi:uncharacterized membrane protein